MINFAFRDLFAVIALVFLLMALLPHNPSKGEDNDATIRAQGELVFTMVWPPELDIDIDLWVEHPSSKRPIGWSNKGDVYCDLLRDDLGARGIKDPVQINYEQVQCRALEVGEYIVTAHYFGGDGSDSDVPVTVETRFVKGSNSVVADVFSVVLAYRSDYKTVTSFIIDGEGMLVDGFSRDQRQMFLQSQDEGM